MILELHIQNAVIQLGFQTEKLARLLQTGNVATEKTMDMVIETYKEMAQTMQVIKEMTATQ